ncbi:MAG: B12-binding domain-containing radical SAM protein [Armatimonadota bacterium]
MNKVIALIAGPSKPPRFAQGLGLPYLAAVLEKAGFKPMIFDVYPESTDTDDPEALDERLADDIARIQPDIVGITIHTPELKERVRLAACLRARLPDTLLVAGGHHPSAEPVDLLQNSDFDVCVLGEGEETLLEIALHEERGSGLKRSDWLRDIDGVVFKADDQVVQTRPRQPIFDLDSLPFPAHHLLGLDRYEPHPNLGIVSAGLVTYRGCPKRCVFCNVPLGRRVRLRSPEKVVNEMAWVVGELGVRGFMCYDNLFGLTRAHALEVCNQITCRELDVTWDSWTAGNLINTELAKSMKKAGCVHVGFGGESGDDYILAKSRRGFTTEQHLAGIRALKTAGVHVQLFLMIGLPGESQASVKNTIEFAMRSGADDVCLSLYRPWPGSAVWRKPEGFGVRITQGPNFEAYIETDSLSRAALLECTEQAQHELTKRGIKCDVLRCDRYSWE